MLHENALYFQERATSGDYWSRIVENAKACAVDPFAPAVLYLVSTNNNVLKTMNHGGEWLTIENGLPANSEKLDIVANPLKKQEVFLLSTAGSYRTNDAGFTWNRFFREYNGILVQLLVHPKQPGLLYGRTSDQGIVASHDEGRTWSFLTSSLPTRVVKGPGRTGRTVPVTILGLAFQSHNSSNLLAFSAEKGVLRTVDMGQTWEQVNTGFSRPGALCSSVETTASGVYVGCNDGIFQLRDDNPTAWTTVPVLRPLYTIEGLLPRPDSSGLLVAHRVPNVQVGTGVPRDVPAISYVGEGGRITGLNYGVTQHSDILAVGVVNDRGTVRILSLVRNRNFTDIWSYGIFYSDDGGETWRPAHVYDQPWRGGPITASIVVSPTRPRDITLLDQLGASRFRSTDGGLSWYDFPLKLTALNDETYQFKYDSKEPGTLYACNGVNGRKLFRLKEGAERGAAQWMDLKVYADAIAIDQDDNSRIVTDSLDITTDGGWTWSSRRKALAYDDNCLEAKRPLWFQGERLIFGVDTASSCERPGGLLLSQDSGLTWSLKKSLKSGLRTLLAQVVTSNPQEIFWGHNEEDWHNTVLEYTDDGGTTWATIAHYRPSENVDVLLSVASALEDGKPAIYLGTLEGLFKTTDRGLHWRLLGGMPDSPSGANATRVRGRQ